MIAEAIEKILNLKRPEVIKINDLDYRLEGYHPVLEKHPKHLGTHTLASIKDFINAGIDGWTDNQLFIHISSHDTVTLYTVAQGGFNQRIALVDADAFPVGFNFNTKYRLEDFIIALNASFVKTDTRDKLLQMISNLSAEGHHGQSDDGISQKAMIKTGIQFMAEVEIKNPMALQPFRTFPEIEQPESEFVFRINNDREIQCSLHPCDGNAWKLVAIERITTWFRENIDIPIAIIA